MEFKQYIDNFESLLNNKRTGIVTSDKTYILTGIEKAYNDTVKNIEVLNTQHIGGCIINFKDDLCIYNFQEGFNNFGKNFIDSFCEYLVHKGFIANINNNDLLINDIYKVASYMTRNIDGILYTAIHISISVDLDLIKQICTKPMNKIPKGLIEFGITTEEVKNFIKKYLDTGLY